MTQTTNLFITVPSNMYPVIKMGALFHFFRAKHQFFCSINKELNINIVYHSTHSAPTGVELHYKKTTDFISK